MQLETPTAVDGEYQLTVFGQTLDVHCADMATTTPTEYLTLPRTGGAYNFSQDSFDFTVTTRCTRIRLTLPTSATGAFAINPEDTRIATSNTGDPSHNRTCGYTGSCAFRTSALNDASLDLTGTSATSGGRPRAPGAHARRRPPVPAPARHLDATATARRWAAIDDVT
ncbi:hypothetical protein ICW40_16690 [Actinotalea ferrariae]|nr:hypothetical protein [Actinotalea ferrariae]